MLKARPTEVLRLRESNGRAETPEGREGRHLKQNTKATSGDGDRAVEGMGKDPMKTPTHSKCPNIPSSQSPQLEFIKRTL